MGVRTIVYRYGCLPPVEGAAVVEDQFWRAGRYYNRLVEIERERRRRIDAAGVKQADTKEAKAALARPINEWAGAEVRAARAASELYWGTYLLVEAAIEQAARTPPRSTMKQDGKIVSRPWWCWPNFRRNTGEGRVGVQIQKGMPTGAVFGADTRLRIDPVPEAAWTGTRGDRRRLTRTRVRLRVGSDGRAPVWGTWPVVYHRQMPVEGRIKWAWIGRRRVGTRWRYELCVTVEGVPTAVAVAASAGRIAVDLGWRVRPDGSIRVGYWADDAGRHGEWSLPTFMRDKLAHARSIEAIRKRAFNEFLPHLADWIDLAAFAAPGWFNAQTRTIRSWRSPDRLARLCACWLRERFAGDEAIFGPWQRREDGVTVNGECPRDANGAIVCDAHVGCWLRRDLHLHDWTDNELGKVIARRQDIFRNWAAWAAQQYRRLVLEDWDMRRVVVETAKGETPQAEMASSVRQSAAPAKLRLALLNAMAGRGGEVGRVASAYTTQTCAACGTVLEFDAAKVVEHTCEACGATWDQDHNAALILLGRDASGAVPPGEGKALAERTAGDGATLALAERASVPRALRRHRGAREAVGKSMMSRIE